MSASDAPPWRCESCRHWKPTPKGLGEGECYQLLWSGADNGPHVWGEYADLTIAVTPDFGCVLHEPKEATQG